MKKFAIITTAILLVFGMVLPTMATDLQINGGFRARGFYKSNADPALGEEKPSDAYFDFRFRPEFVFNINENISVHSRVAIFEESFGTSAKSTTPIWERGWLRIKTAQYGQFDIGRMTGGGFGLDQFDELGAADRIKWTYSVNQNFKTLALTEKYREVAGSATTFERDKEAYAVAGIYKADNWEAGLLIQNVRDEAADSLSVTKTNYFVPYFKAQFYNIGVRGEIKHASGEKEMKNGTTGTDYSGLGLYLAAEIGLGPATVEVGYASASGDDDTTANEEENLTNCLGSEWTPLVVLQDANDLLGQNDIHGVNLFYVQADYKLSEDMTLTGILGKAAANEKRTKTDDDFGMEIDAKLKWKLMDGLTYKFNLGYLMAGDFFGTDPENTYTAYHKIEVAF